MNFNQRITRINGLSDRRRLPRKGIIRLGLKVKNQKGKEYPKETEYFVCPPEVQQVFGEKPTELEIMLPINDIDAVFPQSLKWYGSSKGLKCHGDMKMAYRYNNEEKDWFERECPCEQYENGSCKQSGILMFMIPKVSVGGIYQIRTSSYNSIVDLNSGIDYVSALLDRFALVPLKLLREKTETHHDEKKQYHYTLKILFDVDIDTLNQLRLDTQRVLAHPRYQLPAPITDNPELDPPDIIEDEEKPIEPEIVNDETQNTDGWLKKLNATNKAKLFFEGGNRGLDELELKDLCLWYSKSDIISNEQAKELIGNFENAIENWKGDK